MVRSLDPHARGVVNVAEINPYAPRPYTFSEAALCLRDSIRAAGYASEVHLNRADAMRRCVVLGALPPHTRAVEQLERHKTAIYNLEQLAAAPQATGPDYVHWLRPWLVADYHEANLAWLREATGGAQRALELPLVPGASVAFGPELPRGPQVDVLFYGTPNARRTRILEALREAGLSVEAVAGAFAQELAPAIKRARLVLHVHFYPTGLFPIARMLQPVAQGVPIVCESSVFSPLSDWSRSGIVFADYDALVPACLALLAAGSEAADRAAANLRFARGIDFATPFERLLRAMDAMAPAPTPAPVPVRPASMQAPQGVSAPSMPPARIAPPAMAPAPTPPTGTAPAAFTSRVAADGPLSNEEIEAILAAEADQLPPEAHLNAPPVQMSERALGEGRWGPVVIGMLVAFSLFALWQIWPK